MRRSFFPAFLLLAFAAVGVASAQTLPKLGMLDYAQRLSVSAIGSYDYEYASESADPTLDPGKEFAVGLQGQYLLNPMVTLTFQTKYLTDSKQVRSFLGLSMPFYGKDKTLTLPVGY